MKCLIIDEMYPDIGQLLQSKGISYEYQPDISRDEIISVIHQYDGLIVRSKTRVDKEILDPAKNLKFIARAGAGIDNIDQAICVQKNIQIFNAPEANRDAVGEHGVGMLLALFNKLNTADLEVRKGLWLREQNRGTEIQGKTVGIIGYGNMGSAFAKRLRGFDCRVIAYDKFKKNYGDDIAEEVGLETLFAETDILSLHVPLTDETNRMVDKQFLASFKKPIILINMARGKVVVLRDLIAELEGGSIKGAALDVLENEKINELTKEQQSDFDHLIKMPNVLLTPHVAGWSFESYQKINKILVDKIAAFVHQLGI